MKISKKDKVLILTDKQAKKVSDSIFYESQKIAPTKVIYLDKFGKRGTYDLNASGVIIQNGLMEKVYQRVLIKHKKK